MLSPSPLYLAIYVLSLPVVSLLELGGQDWLLYCSYVVAAVNLLVALDLERVGCGLVGGT